MKSKTINKLIFSALLMVFGIVSTNAQSKENNQPKTPPTAKELIKQMDKNEDGKLSKAEVKGPLKDDFKKIDTNEDGFLTIKELEKAPKPKRKEKR
ncbi:EF hand domain-containing protein [Gillisia sp. Hel_I_86]|uniref:EF-hand domain-containing protein n=1 Tax=Gillisia sp. Hel_I_86 TaxID=1249981 RepID=UPI00119AF9BF|nr:EF-hand domain-containing protein [Gillisia sp. Hel_I_86]TVZ27946.1 EF hand domain-containing protein [Gillisia sp. Hel_I_86]